MSVEDLFTQAERIDSDALANAEQKRSMWRMFAESVPEDDPRRNHALQRYMYWSGVAGEAPGPLANTSSREGNKSQQSNLSPESSSQAQPVHRAVPYRRRQARSRHEEWYNHPLVLLGILVLGWIGMYWMFWMPDSEAETKRRTSLTENKPRLDAEESAYENAGLPLQEKLVSLAFIILQENLKDPRSASLLQSKIVGERGDGNYLVFLEVRAANSFGGYANSAFAVYFKYDQRQDRYWSHPYFSVSELGGDLPFDYYDYEYIKGSYLKMQNLRDFDAWLMNIGAR